MRRAAAVGKGVLAGLLHAGGFLQRHQRRVLKGRAVALMYHRVVTAAERPRVFSHESILVDTDTFELHLRLLKRHFTVISADELLDRLGAGRPLRDNSCLITFDDGWRDNYLNALPLLRRYDLPATVFVASGFIGTDRRFWQERLAAALQALLAAPVATRSPQARAALLRLGLDAQRPGSRGCVKSAVDRIVDSRKRFAPEENEGLIADLESCGIPASAGVARAFMDWDEVRAMQSAGTTFGAHGVTHRMLTDLTPDEVLWEVRSSRETLLAELGRAPRVFSYPNGYRSPAIEEAVRACGFEAAFGTRKGFLDGGCARFALGRVNIPSSVTATAPRFFARVLGIW